MMSMIGYQKNQSKFMKEMVKVADKAGFILADLKLEFGKLNNEIILADSIGPDEFRLWSKDLYKIGKTQEAYDKQLLRDWLTENGYQKKFEMHAQEVKILSHHLSHLT